jgi:hypothetical protein
VNYSRRPQAPFGGVNVGWVLSLTSQANEPSRTGLAAFFKSWELHELGVEFSTHMDVGVTF